MDGRHCIRTLFLTLHLFSNNRDVYRLPLEDCKKAAGIKGIYMLFRLLPGFRSRRIVNGEEAIGREEAAERKREPDRIGEVVRFLNPCASGDSKLMQESIEVGSHCDDVYSEGSKVEPFPERVRAFRTRSVEFVDSEEAAAEKVVVAYEDPGDGGEEDLVRGQEGYED